MPIEAEIFERGVILDPKEAERHRIAAVRVLEINFPKGMDIWEIASILNIEYRECRTALMNLYNRSIVERRRYGGKIYWRLIAIAR